MSQRHASDLKPVLPPHANAEVHRRLMADLAAMTPEEIFQTAVRSGIYAPDGQLLPPYAPEAGDAPTANPVPPAKAVRR